MRCGRHKDKMKKQYISTDEIKTPNSELGTRLKRALVGGFFADIRGLVSKTVSSSDAEEKLVRAGLVESENDAQTVLRSLTGKRICCREGYDFSLVFDQISQRYTANIIPQEGTY